MKPLAFTILTLIFMGGAYSAHNLVGIDYHQMIYLLLVIFYVSWFIDEA